MKTFGILGGQGAVATLRLHQFVVEHALDLGAVQDHEFPSLIVGSLSAPVLDEHGEVNSGADLDAFIKTHKSMFQDADIVVAPCNTLHSHVVALREVFGGKFVSLIDIVAEAIPDDVHVMVAGSSITKQELLFESAKPFNRFSHVSDDLTTDLILAGMGGRRGSDSYVDKQLVEMVVEFEYSGADILLLGCTDLSVFSPDLIEAGVPHIDALKVLSNYIIREYLSS